MTLTEQQLDQERALVLMDADGTGEQCEPDSYTIVHYAPEWLSRDDLGCERDECHTELHFGFSPYPERKGYRIAYTYGAGERECPWCGPGTGNEESRDDCALCEGDGVVYWGEDCAVVVYAPKRYHVICGLQGCYMSNTNDVCDSLQDARDVAVSYLKEARENGERVAIVTPGHVWALGEYEMVAIIECPCNPECRAD